MRERVVVGIGASRGAATTRCVDAVGSLLRPEWILSSVATVEAKAAMMEPVADAFGVPLTVWPAAELAGIEVPNPSSRVLLEVGSASVAEAAAILGSGHGRLLVTKTNIDGVSVAIACADD